MTEDNQWKEVYSSVNSCDIEQGIIDIKNRYKPAKRNRQDTFMRIQKHTNLRRILIEAKAEIIYLRREYYRNPSILDMF